jgi:hypothetical protein
VQAVWQRVIDHIYFWVVQECLITTVSVRDIPLTGIFRGFFQVTAGDGSQLAAF